MNFNINKDLDIILITYNRVNKLKDIVSDILNENSPIKNCSITFLDNCSTDGTSEFLEELSMKYKNIVHIRHKINIGGNANIVRAFEYVSKKYFWILCDDDRLNFTYWEDIKNALESNKFDIIETYTDPKVFSGETYKDRLAKFIVEIVLLPAAIYRSKYLYNNDVIFNSYTNIYALIPHMALISTIINNKNNKIYFCEDYERQILLQGYVEKSDYKRGIKKTVHPFMQNMDLSIGFALSLSMLADKELKYKCVDRIRSYLNLTFEGFIGEMPYYWIQEGLNDNLMAIYNACNDRQRKSFIDRISELTKQFKMYNRNTLKIRSFHIINFYKIEKKVVHLSFLGYSFIRNRERPKFNCLFSFTKDIYYLKITFLFIRLTIKLFR